MLRNFIHQFKTKRAIKTLLAHQHQAFRLQSGKVLQPGTAEHAGFVQGVQVCATLVGVKQNHE